MSQAMGGEYPEMVEDAHGYSETFNPVLQNSKWQQLSNFVVQYSFELQIAIHKTYQCH